MEPETKPTPPPVVDYDVLLDRSKSLLSAAVAENQKGPCPMDIPETFDSMATAYGGALIEEVETHMAELFDLVEEMKKSLVEEVRILEGTKVPVYGENEPSETQE
jgi:hypothetical protein